MADGKKILGTPKPKVCGQLFQICSVWLVVYKRTQLTRTLHSRWQCHSLDVTNPKILNCTNPPDSISKVGVNLGSGYGRAGRAGLNQFGQCCAAGGQLSPWSGGRRRGAALRLAPHLVRHTTRRTLGQRPPGFQTAIGFFFSWTDWVRTLFFCVFLLLLLIKDSEKGNTRCWKFFWWRFE